MIDFNQRVALVTGAGRGLGFAYAKALAALGATVIVQDSGTDADGGGSDATVAHAAAARIAEAGGRAIAASGPIVSRQDCASLVDGIVAGHGRIDVLIHNAGWVGYQAIENLEPEFLDRMMRLGVDTALWLTQAAWLPMRRAGFGRVLLTTSDRGIYPEYAQEGLAAYAAAKMATVGIVNTLSQEGRAHGITVNAISPVAKTRMWGIEDEPEDLRPDAVAPGAVYLVSPGCEASGRIMRASNGQFVATRAKEASGVSYPRDLAAVPADTPDAVAAAWDHIAIDVPEVRPPANGPVSVAFAGMAVLGECPLWSERRNRLLWVDTEGRTLNLFDPATGRNQAIGMPDVIGMVAERADGTLVAALGCDLATIDHNGGVHRIATAPHGGTGFRLNDGRFDADGRLWIGLMDNTLREGTAILYRYDPDGIWHVMDEGFTLVNGLDWSPDRRTLYVTDSRAPAIYAYDHDPATGSIGDRTTFVAFGPDDGFPDGLLVGPDGTLWSTMFGAGAVQHIDANGRFIHRIELPTSRPTSCAFSHDGTALYVTTARLGLNDAALGREPIAGAIFRIDFPWGR